MLSICVTVKNRSRVLVEGLELLLLPNCVRSVVEATLDFAPCELVIADWGSDDWPLDQWLFQSAMPLATQLIQVEGPFCRGRGRNIAAANARGDVLFFLDADCMISDALVKAGLRHIQQGASFFPVLFSFDSPRHENGWWRHEGFGNCMVTRETWAAVGGWPELPSWGKEDNDFYTKVASHMQVIRTEAPGFFHQWHPETIDWKDRYREDAEIQELRQTLGELWKAIPTGETLILVDEARCGGHEHGHGRNIVPFTENEGVYWGPPADDQAAIQELERQRAQGASYIAFILGTAWWLDHYRQFRVHLENRYACQLKSSQIILFSLR